MVIPRKPVLNITRCEHGGLNIQYLKKIGLYRYANKKAKIIDFSINVNPYGPPKEVFGMLCAEELELDRYPDTDVTELRSLISKQQNCLESNIIVGNGISEILHLIALTFIDKNRRVLIPKHTYGEYEIIALMMGGRIKKIDMPDLKLDINYFEEKMMHNCIVFICNPNNPTGEYLSYNSIKYLVELVEDTDSLLIIDEAYIDFVNKPYDLSRIAKKSENIIVLRSFTKAFGIPGLRLGYAIGNETNIWLLNNVKPPWNVSIVAQKIGCVLLKCEDFLKSSKSRIERTKEHVASNLDVLPSDVNFFLYKVGDARTAVKKLISKNIFVRDCTSFALPQYIRFSVRKHYETTFLIKCVKSLKK